jgi:ATP-binding cassette, subfamily B, bacterial
MERIKKRNSICRIYESWYGYNRWFYLSIFITILSLVCWMAVPFISIPLINEGIIGKNMNTIVNYGLLMFIVTILIGIFDSINAYLAVYFSEYTAHELREEAYNKIQQLSFSNLDKFRTSDMLIRLTTDLQNVKIAVQQTIFNLFRAPIMLAFATAVVFIVAPSLTWIAVVLIVVVTVSQIIFLIVILPAYSYRQKQFDNVNRTLRENMAGVRVVKAFVRQISENVRFQKVAESLRIASLKPLHWQACLVPGLFFVVFMGIAGFYYFGGIQIIEDTGLTIGALVASGEFIWLALFPIFILVAIFPLLNSGRASLDRVYELIDAIPDIQDKEDPIKFDTEQVKGRLVFDNVNFGYSGNDGDYSSMFLRDINLVIEPGEIVGFLGATGCGKSTLVNLVPRFYDVANGKITIDGMDIREISQNDLRGIVGICLQETNLFSGTIKDNILFGAPDASYDEMVIAAKAANAHDFISNIPAKYDGRIARRGTNLSGGQRQRISIARALIKKPKILILDDSTSACDLTTEAQIQDAIKEIMKETTQLIVAQRISSVITADKIILLEEGRIVAVGNHEELLAANHLYQEIYNSQLGEDYRPSLGEKNEKK